MGTLEVFHISFLTNTCLQGAPPAPFLSPSTNIKIRNSEADKQQIPRSPGYINMELSDKVLEPSRVVLFLVPVI